MAIDRRAVEALALEVRMLARSHGLEIAGIEILSGHSAKKTGRRSQRHARTSPVNQPDSAESHSLIKRVSSME
jgi:hypothetical protein